MKTLQVLAVFSAGLVFTIAGALLYAGAQAAKEPIQAVPTAAKLTTPVSLPESTAPATDAPDEQPSSGSLPPSTTQAAPLKADTHQDSDASGLSGRSSSNPVLPAGPVLPASPVPTAGAQPGQKPKVIETPIPSPLVNSASSEEQHIEYSAGQPEMRPQIPRLPRTTSAGPSQTAQKTPEVEQKSKLVTVPEGTIVSVRLAETLSSDHNRTGDTFRATLATPLIVTGSVIAETGATVLGRVANARRAPLIGGKSNLTLTLTHLTGAEERLFAVDTSIVEETGSHTNIVNTAKMAAGAAVGAVVGAVRGAGEGSGITSSLRGGDSTNGFMATNRTVVIPAGTRFIFRLNTPFTVTQ